MEGNTTEGNTPAPVPTRTRSEGVSDSWKDPAVAAARKERHSVIVKSFGDDPKTIQYKSVTEAFKALDLPMGQHITFRAKLKAEGVKTFTVNGDGAEGEEKREYEFHIAPAIKVEPKPRKAKVKPEAASEDAAEADESTEAAAG